MTRVSAAGLDALMDPGPRPRVAVAVLPRLLADVLSRVLDRTDLDVVVCAAPELLGPSSGGRPFEVAVISGAPPANLGAQIVIRLPDGPGNVGMGSVRTSAGEEAVELHGLAEVVTILDRLLPPAAGHVLAD